MKTLQLGNFIFSFNRYLTGQRQGEIGARITVENTFFALQVFLWWRVLDIRLMRPAGIKAEVEVWRRR